MPGLAMQALSRHKIRSFLLTSGTLSPLSSFAAELQLNFPITLENPHVIEASQVLSGITETMSSIQLKSMGCWQGSSQLTSALCRD